MFDITTFSLASAVANNGTVTVGYPAGKSKGDYALTTGAHILFVNGNKYQAPQDFTLTFNANASDITLTNKSGGSFPISANCTLQIDRAGVDSGKLEVLSPITRVTPVLPVLIDLGSPDVADSDGYCASQDLTAAGVFSTSVTAAAAIAAAALAGEADVPRNVVASWTGAAVITVTGTDEYGDILVESSGSGTSFTGKKAFKTVTDIAVSADVTSLTVGTGAKLGLPVAVRKAGMLLGEFKDGQLVGKGSPAITRLNWFAEQVSVLAGTTAAIELISPITGAISKLGVAVRVAVGTGGTVTAKIGTTDVDGLSVTVANSATKGTTATDSPTAGHASTLVAKGDRIQIVFDDAFATSGALDGYLEITPTDDASYGTFVAADGTEATATTGDVRGTYTMGDTADGSIGCKLLAVLPDPNDLGVAQFAG